MSHIQDECMAHEEDMLAFEYDSGWGGQDEENDDFAEDGGFFLGAPWRVSCTEPCRLQAAHPPVSNSGPVCRCSLPRLTCELAHLSVSALRNLLVLGTLPRRIGAHWSNL